MARLMTLIARPVRTPQGLFHSVWAAAKHHGISIGVAHYRAARRILGWRFADE